MIAVDTSALMAILLDEPAADACIAALEREDEIVMSAGTLDIYCPPELPCNRGDGVWAWTAQHRSFARLPIEIKLSHRRRSIFGEYENG